MSERIKYRLFTLMLVASFVAVSCDNYLDVASDSKFDSEFVFQSEYEADKAILGLYQLFYEYTGVHSHGLFYDAIAVGSDIELGPEAPSFGGRYNIENCYAQPPQLSDVPTVYGWDGIYQTINRCNVIIDAFENNKSFIETDKNQPSEITHLYAEAVAMRACLYYELTRNWGDVIYNTRPIATKEDYVGAIVNDRNLIQEKEIAHLMEVEPMMFQLNSGGHSKSAIRMTKEFVHGLIARLALIRGGFALRPAYYSGDGEIIQSHPQWGKMVRRTDYLEYYKLANTYLKKLVYEGNATLVTSDPRMPAEKYNNPFQWVFQNGMDYQISSESIFEISHKTGEFTERPYAFGRPSDGGYYAYPPKAYGQVRFYPTFYYGMFHPKDLRRDVTVTVTALGGAANEKMLTFKKGNKSNGGLALNKWDYSRLIDKQYAFIQRQTGINAPYMRLDDMILLLAETYAVLGDEGSAKIELLKIRERAFNPNDPDFANLTVNYINSKSGDELVEAIQNERAFELAGEGQRRYDLVRWGILGDKIYKLQSEMTALINALQSEGHYRFENGNILSTYIYTKEIKKEESGLDNILTSTCMVGKNDPLYPLLYPGWRGTFTDYNTSSGTKLLNIIVGIEGLFESLNDSEKNDLIEGGYKQTNWGIDLINEAWGANVKGIFGGYLPSDYLSNYPPRYLIPIPATTITYSGGNISNSYGFPNE